MSRARVHLLARTTATGMAYGLCGWFASATSSVIAEVTCKLCLRKHSPPKSAAAKASARAAAALPPGAPRPHETEEVWRELTRPARAQESTGWDGVVTPEIWQSSCLRRGSGDVDECGVCVACERVKDLRRWAAMDGVFERDPVSRLHEEQRYRYRNPNHMLEPQLSPSDSKSTAGSFETLLRHGCRIDGGEMQQTQPIHRYIEDLVDRWRAKAALFDEHNDRGVGAAVCWMILRARVIGHEELVHGRDGRQHWIRKPVPAVELAREHGVTVAMVAAIVKSGMRRLRVELAARDMIPPPPRKSGLADEIHRRRRELLNDTAWAEREGTRPGSGHNEGRRA